MRENVHKIAYITVRAPFGILGETYILPEMKAMNKLGVELMIFPRDKSNTVFHNQAKLLIKRTLSCSRFNTHIMFVLLKFALTSPVLFIKLINKIVVKSPNPKIAIKNLLILPKGVYLSTLFTKKPVDHIHAHYGSTTSTMAYIISEITAIPWSFTLHRWDIPENNLLNDKCKSAEFVRTIDEQGRKELIEILKEPSLNKKISVIHVGVDMPSINGDNKIKPDRFTFLCPAMFVLKKGHKYLIEACRILYEKGIPFNCLLAGDGMLKEELRKMVGNYDLNECVEFLGALSQERIFDLYRNGLVNAVILPSIVTENGAKEGIPVSLMEAMAFKIPVISTNTGGIGELIGDGSGIMIEEKDPVAIADSIEKLMNDNNCYNMISERGREKVEGDFNVNVISRNLLDLFLQKSFN